MDWMLSFIVSGVWGLCISYLALPPISTPGGRVLHALIVLALLSIVLLKRTKGSLSILFGGVAGLLLVTFLR